MATTQSTQSAVAQAVQVELARRGRKQSWLAVVTGMSQSSLSNRLTGRITIDANDVDIFAEAFDMSAAELLIAAAAEAARTQAVA